MKFTLVSVSHHPLKFPDTQLTGFIDGILITSYFKYANPDNPNHIPVMIDWKYRLFHENKHISTYIAETKIAIEKDGIEANTQHLDDFIKDLYLNVEIGWEGETINTRLHGTTLPAMTPEVFSGIRVKIIGMTL